MQNFRQVKTYIWIKTIWMILSAITFTIATTGFIISNFLKFQFNGWLVFLAISLLSFISSIIYFSVKDPINNVTKYKLNVLLEYCYKSNGFVVYSEFITYISALCNVIANNSNLTKYEPEKIVARAWRNISKSKSMIKNQKQYKHLCKELSDYWTKNPNGIDEGKVSRIINEIENECNDSEDIKLFKSILEWIKTLFKSIFARIKTNLFIVLNIISFILIILGFIATFFKVNPLDTYLYGIASILLVLYAIIIELNKKSVAANDED